MKSYFGYLTLALSGAAAAVAVTLAVSHGSAAPSTSSSTTKPKTAVISSTPSTSSSALNASQVYQKDSSGVVAIQSASAEETDTGTGIVLDNNGDIVTNDHVVSGGTTITVSPGNNSKVTRTAQVVGEDSDADLAVIKIDPSGLGLKPLTFADSGNVKVGSSVFAIGNPYGLDETLTTGIVSALDRQIQAPDGANINGAIQTDAALNPGNSGGPLINAQGDVIGINSQIASDESSAGGGQPGSTGVGFAIASNTVTSVVKQIESSGNVPSQVSPQTQGGQQTVSPYGDPYGSGGAGGGYGYGDPYGGGGVVVVPGA